MFVPLSHPPPCQADSANSIGGCLHSEKERLALFSGHSLRAGLASSADVDERYMCKSKLGHASPEMTRRYQRSTG